MGKCTCIAKKNWKVDLSHRLNISWYVLHALYPNRPPCYVFSSLARVGMVMYWPEK